MIEIFKQLRRNLSRRKPESDLRPLLVHAPLFELAVGISGTQCETPASPSDASSDFSLGCLGSHEPRLVAWLMITEESTELAGQCASTRCNN
jgi:hypothetical protein